MRRGALAALVLGLVPLAAQASPYRLRGDALVQARDPSGVIALDGQGEITKELGIEVLLWAGAGGEPSPEGDLLVAALSYRDAQGRGEVRAGRLLVSSGALWPLQLDGIVALARLPTRTTLEVFGGMPVVPRFGARSWDWAAGGRIAQNYQFSTIGLGYLQQRTGGMLERHELAADLAIFPGTIFDLAARGSLDLISMGPAELALTAAANVGAFRVEAFGSHRSPSRLLPATSLFSVLGDRAVRSFGARVGYPLTPRLWVEGGAGGRLFDDTPYEDLVLRTRLALGPQASAGSVGLELHRQGAPLGGWTGVRAFARFPLVSSVSAAVELELVGPDQAGDRGGLWPWGLVGVSWTPLTSWELAAALEASSTPESARSFDAVFRVAYLWGDS